MARVESWTRNGDKLTVETDDEATIRQLEDAALDPSSNISSTRVTEG